MRRRTIRDGSPRSSLSAAAHSDRADDARNHACALPMQSGRMRPARPLGSFARAGQHAAIRTCPSSPARLDQERHA
eukprot:scaffold192727_cov31-Tisochrysis_lutea.AAC.7